MYRIITRLPFVIANFFNLLYVLFVLFPLLYMIFLFLASHKWKILFSERFFSMTYAFVVHILFQSNDLQSLIYQRFESLE